MSELLGTTWPVFIAVTLVLAGGAAWMTGQALANRWRPAWQVAGYSLLLGLADRFITYALFGGELLSVTGYLIDTAIIMAVALVCYRLTKAGNMVAQYPWIYRREGLFSWREIGPQRADDA